MPRITAKKDESISWRVTEVKLGDFANAVTYNGSRLTKGLSFRPSADALSSHDNAELGWSWFDDENVAAPQLAVDDPMEKAVPASCVAGVTASGEYADDSAVIYPMDVWSILSDYINPCDVGTFTAICWGTRRATRTRRFWRRLYLRYYAKDKHLPPDLQPHMLQRPAGLVARVIRALHFLHEPLVGRACRITSLSAETSIDRCTETLEGLQCQAVWYVACKKEGSGGGLSPRRHTWKYCFKFGRRSACMSAGRRPASAASIHYNPEAGCHVLVVLSDHYVHLPQVTGLTLCTAKMSGGAFVAGGNDRKVRLLFSTLPSLHNRHAGEQVAISIEPVFECHAYPWWHPDYPVYV